MKIENYYTPELVVAGAREYGSVNPDEAAFNALCVSLGTEEFAMITKIVGDKVYYAGAMLSDFINQGESKSLVYSVLGVKDGAYIIDEPTYSILIVKEGDEYTCHSGNYDDVRKACDEGGLKPEELSVKTHESQSWRVENLDRINKRRSINERVVIYSGVASILFVAAWIGIVAATGFLTEQNTKYDLSISSKITKAVRTIPSYHPVDRTLSEMSVVKMVTSKSGGWINKVEFDEGEVGYELMMPLWVTQDYIAPLGRMAKAGFSEDENMIKVVKPLGNSK